MPKPQLKTVRNNEAPTPSPKLQDYFGAPKPQARRFVNALAKARINRFDEEDSQRSRSAALQRQEIPTFLHDLAYAALRSRDANVKRSCLAEVGTLLYEVLKQEVGWSPAESESATEAFKRIVDAYASKRQDKAQASRSLSVVLTAALYLQYTRSLDPHDAAVMLANSESAGRIDRSKVITDFLAKPPTKPKQFARLSKVLLALSDVAASERGRANELRDDLTALRETLSSMRSELEAVREQLQSLGDERQKDQQRIKELEEQLRTKEITASSALAEIKGRARGLLQNKLGRLIVDAKEAASVTPPSIRVITERLDLLSGEIEGALQWLASE
jgi:regulator of replication initiation timing